MGQRLGGGYDSGYAACPCFWGREPSSLVQRLIEQVGRLDGWLVLDAGCGEGKNAAFMARLGASVWAIDVSTYALANAEEAWPDLSGIKWEAGDIRTLTLMPERYDLVVAYGLLHCLNDVGEIADVVDKLQRATKSSGYHVLCAFNERHQELHAHPGFNPCLVGHDFYMGLYRDWRIIESSDSDLTEQHPHNGIKHTHSMTRILAQRV